MQLTREDVDVFEIKDYLGKKFDCKCGRKHGVGIEDVIIESGAINRLPQIMKENGYKKAFVVSDNNTYLAAGKKVEGILRDNKYNTRSLIYERKGHLVPDERALGEFMAYYHKDVDVLIVVGSGVLSDISKYISHMLDIPSIMVATAPSMDGYASVGSAFILKSTKISLNSMPPNIIIGDIDVLRRAPMDMIVAGLGDMLGKYSSLRDWKLSNIVTGEYHCSIVEYMVRSSLEKCIENIEGYARRDEAAIGHLMEGLVLAGIAMSFIGNSRPASGSEHHMSHFWELISLMEQRTPVAHGIQVGIATLITTGLAKKLIDMDVDFDNILDSVASIDIDRWEDEIGRVYKDAAQETIKLNKKPLHEMISERKKRVISIRDNWNEILRTLKKGPESRQIEKLYKTVGRNVATRPIDVGFDRNLILDTILYAKEVRQRYTILQLLWDLGLLEDLAIDLTRGGKVSWQAHQSSTTEVPENTMAAFEYAWNLGGIPEADIRTTKDRVIICLHDSALMRTGYEVPDSYKDVDASLLNFEDLRQIDVGSKYGKQYKGEGIPALRDVFKAMKQSDDRLLYLDFKDVVLEELVNLIEEYDIGNRIIFAHNSHDNCIKVKSMLDGIGTMLWIGGKADAIKEKFERARASNFKGLTQVQLHLNDKSTPHEGWRYDLDLDFIRYCYDIAEDYGIDLEVLPFEFSREDIYTLLDIGIRWFAVDYPKRFVDYVKDYQNPSSR
ncbi:MAG: iron-containing alcohol dehydrogenase [Clostridiales bacterium]|nr:iron-containing alcohol dehydrogenase [Clostridiales bacterium]